MSVSIWTPALRVVRSPGALERAAVGLLADVGNDREWWIWRPGPAVGHLRVGCTADETAALGDWPAEHDAGPSGPERPRTRRTA